MSYVMYILLAIYNLQFIKTLHLPTQSVASTTMEPFGVPNTYDCGMELKKSYYVCILFFFDWVEDILLVVNPFFWLCFVLQNESFKLMKTFFPHYCFHVPT